MVVDVGVAVVTDVILVGVAVVVVGMALLLMDVDVTGVGMAEVVIFVAGKDACLGGRGNTHANNLG
jgi:hypothetical protein